MATTMRDRYFGDVSGQVAVQQHQIVYEALKAEMGGKLHALALQTSAPEQAG